MNVVTIDSKVWEELNKRLKVMEKTLLDIVEVQNQIVLPAHQGYISINDAVIKYKISRVTINKKALKYKISRLQSGKHNLLKESELISALKQKEPVPSCFQNKLSLVV